MYLINFYFTYMLRRTYQVKHESWEDIILFVHSYNHLSVNGINTVAVFFVVAHLSQLLSGPVGCMYLQP